MKHVAFVCLLAITGLALASESNGVEYKIENGFIVINDAYIDQSILTESPFTLQIDDSSIFITNQKLGWYLKFTPKGKNLDISSYQSFPNKSEYKDYIGKISAFLAERYLQESHGQGVGNLFQTDTLSKKDNHSIHSFEDGNGLNIVLEDDNFTVEVAFSMEQTQDQIQEKRRETCTATGDCDSGSCTGSAGCCNLAIAIHLVFTLECEGVYIIGPA